VLIEPDWVEYFWLLSTYILNSVIEAPLLGLAVAANLVGDATLVVDGEETVICPKLDRQEIEMSNASVKDLNAYSGGRVWVFLCVCNNVRNHLLWIYKY